MVVRVAVGQLHIAAVRPESRSMGVVGGTVFQGVVTAFCFKGIAQFGGFHGIDLPDIPDGQSLQFKIGARES